MTHKLSMVVFAFLWPLTCFLPGRRPIGLVPGTQLIPVEQEEVVLGDPHHLEGGATFDSTILVVVVVVADAAVANVAVAVGERWPAAA